MITASVIAIGSMVTGSIPSTFNSTTLTHFDLDFTAVTGIIPTTIGMLTNLVNLRLGSTLSGQVEIYGTIPTEMAACTKLGESSLFRVVARLPNLYAVVIV